MSAVPGSRLTTSPGISETASVSSGNKPEASAVPKLQAIDLNFYYGKFHALHNISLSVPEKKITALIGPSGCGKSTFLRTLNRINEMVRHARAEGSVQLDGENVLNV